MRMIHFSNLWPGAVLVAHTMDGGSIPIYPGDMAPKALLEDADQYIRKGWAVEVGDESENEGKGGKALKGLQSLVHKLGLLPGNPGDPSWTVEAMVSALSQAIAEDVARVSDWEADLAAQQAALEQVRKDADRAAEEIQGRLSAEAAEAALQAARDEADPLPALDPGVTEEPAAPIEAEV